MHFSEDDLRQALKRQEPGSGFTQRVMARVNQAKVEGPVEIKREPAVKKSNGAFLAWWKLRPAWSFAVVAILLLAFGVGGYQYSEYRHKEEIKSSAREPATIRASGSRKRSGNPGAGDCTLQAQPCFAARPAFLGEQ